MEIEVKFRIDFNQARAAIESLGADFVREELQEDLYFSLPPHELLRVRRISNLGRSFLTYKRIADPGRNEEFDEIEVEVSDFDRTVEILKRLGFREDIWIRKRRLVYRLDGVTFELNEVEGLGAFLDIEVISDNVEEAKRRIWEIAGRLGLTEDDVEPRLYQELIREVRGK
ncbi:adenylate cyclase [Thermococcus sp. 4557]|uniref:class IV adenylate cyclase n=1 Tax=Thermococcus sp. (strain CGMCC 1.5172 / 4557) TaxID=1042877 RepID=UPI000219EC4B|nr:class IV adenylate cyclase [Thermococcus sp. 4557]AEK72231.1 adenylate cyclase [Thermococcus sp. 4557]